MTSVGDMNFEIQQKRSSEVTSQRNTNIVYAICIVTRHSKKKKNKNWGSSGEADTSKTYINVYNMQFAYMPW